MDDISKLTVLIIFLLRLIYELVRDFKLKREVKK